MHVVARLVDDPKTSCLRHTTPLIFPKKKPLHTCLITMKFSAPFLAILAAAMAPSAAAFSNVQPTPAVNTALSMSASPTPATRDPNPVIKVAAQGMGLLKPLFALEANIQAAALGAVTGVDKEDVAQEVADTIAQNKVLIYTYALSPFSTEAVAMLEGSGYDFTKLELGAEWFALGGRGSETRVLLSKEVDNGATSLPKIFVGGKCIGGCAELAGLVESGELDSVMKAAGVSKRGEVAAKKSPFGGFFN